MPLPKRSGLPLISTGIDVKAPPSPLSYTPSTNGNSSTNQSLTNRESEPYSHLRAFTFHGVDLSIRGSQAIGDCPFCMGEGKFTIQVETGLWRCWVCGGGLESGGGNPVQFLRALYMIALDRRTTDFCVEVANNRRICNTETIERWGIVRSIIPPYPWLVAGYGSNGDLNQLYKRTHIDGSWLLLPTPGVWPEGRVHALHLPIDDFDLSRPCIDVLEGPWDGAAFWEVTKQTNKRDTNIIAVPGCNVWRDGWSRMCKDKDVTLWYDSDYPRENNQRAGWDGMCRVAKRLSGYAHSVKIIRWGEDGYDPTRPNGWDIRDALSGAPNPPYPMGMRVNALQELSLKVENAPADWFTMMPHIGNGRANRNGVSIEAQPCNNWVDCEAAWDGAKGGAMQWRQAISDTLAVCLAVCASTQQSGNQLFLDIVGSPGCGKTTLCEGLLVSHHCHHLEHLTGFHSGFKKKGEDDKDCSLIARINGKTLITPEFDTMRTSPRYQELMSQTRRIFDGKSGATYKNSDEDTLYVGLRTPWIRAGTPASIMDSDQSQLGDRFQRIIIGDPTEEEKRAIMRSALRSERVAMIDQANGTAGSIVDSKTRKAHALTGGYVDWLRDNVEELLPKIDIPDTAEELCIDLAEFCADMRARPNEDKYKKSPDSYDGKELPTRLTRQNIRLAAHLCVILNKPIVDSAVLRIVRKVALDTAYGHSLNVVTWLCRPNPKTPGESYNSSGGLGTKTLEIWLNMPKDRTVNYLMFMKRIGVLELNYAHGDDAWTLTERVDSLLKRVMKG